MTSSRSCVGWTTVVTAALLISGVISDTVETDGPSATYIQPVIEGDNLLVVCNTTAPVPDVYWTRNQTGSTFRQNGTELEFNDIQRTSSGDYLCHVINETDHDDDIVDVVTVDVHYPAKFNMSKTPRVVRENMQLDIVCTIEAHPPADMVLMSNTSDKVYFEGTHGTGIVDVGLVTAQWYMTGLYVCTGQNYLNHGVNDTDTADVTVETRPIPDPYANMTYDEVAFLGKDVEFYLEYVGIPPPTSIKWEHDNKTLSPSHQHDVNGSSTLNVTNISVPDYGEYVITLTNEIGSSQAKYNIHPKGGPQRPTDLEYFDVTYEAVTLRWKSGFDMGSRQHFTVWKQVGPNSYQTEGKELQCVPIYEGHA